MRTKKESILTDNWERCYLLKYRCVQTAIHWDHGLCTGAQNGTGGYGGNASWSLSAGAVPGSSLCGL